MYIYIYIYICIFIYHSLLIICGALGGSYCIFGIDLDGCLYGVCVDRGFLCIILSRDASDILSLAALSIAFLFLANARRAAAI